MIRGRAAPVPQVVRPGDVQWVVPAGVEPNAGGDALRKKALLQDAAGFFNQIVSCPPHWVVPEHTHDHDELFVVIRGSCEVNGEPMGPLDSAALPAGFAYGIVAGDQGLEFMVVRTSAVETTLAR